MPKTSTIGRDNHRTHDRRAVRAPALRRRGLSLLEVVLAIAILGGAIAVMGELIRVGVRAAVASRDLTKAELYAESKMAEITAGILTPTALDFTTLDVMNQEEMNEWMYSIDIQEGTEAGLIAVRVTVQRNLDPSQRPTQFSLVRWMIDPQTMAELHAAQAEIEAAMPGASGETESAGTQGETSGQ